MPGESMMDKIKNAGSDMVDKGKEQAGDIFHQVEGLARENTGESKQKLMDMAKEHGINVDEGMDIGQIKNKIKEKIRNKM